MERIIIKGGKVSPAEIEENIIATSFHKLGHKIVVCHLTLKNGFECIGKAGVVDGKLFDFEIGKKFAKQRAIDEVWGHLGSLLQNQLLEK